MFILHSDIYSLKGMHSFFNNFLPQILTLPVKHGKEILTLNLSEGSLIVIEGNQCKKIKIGEKSNSGYLSASKEKLALALNGKLLILNNKLEQLKEYQEEVLSNIVCNKHSFYFRTRTGIMKANENNCQLIYSLEKTGFTNSKFNKIFTYKSKLVFIDGQDLVIFNIKTNEKKIFKFPLTVEKKTFFLENALQIVKNKIFVTTRYKILSIDLDTYKLEVIFKDHETSNFIIKADYQNVYGYQYFIQNNILLLINSLALQCYDIKTKASITLKYSSRIDKPQWIFLHNGTFFICDEYGNIFTFQLSVKE